MSIVNTSKPTTAIVDVDKVDIAETWDSNTTTWDTETRTWDEMSSTITNSARITTSITNQVKP
jgi:hypothetical protein